MVKDFTQEDLVAFIYKDLDAGRSAEIKSALASNWKLKEEYNELVESLGVLNKMTLRSPHPSSIQLIMEHSRRTAAEQELETSY